MYEPPSFFVPSVEAEKQEEVYATLAKLCNCPVPAQGRRISSITFDHDGVRWNAIVGEKLHGEKKKVSRSKGKKIETILPVFNYSTVVAIFPGKPCFVFIDQSTVGRGIHWANPFMATAIDIGDFA